METINIEKDISSHDALTKVMSRNSYDNTIKEFNKRIHEEPLTVNFAICECDLNNLKIINDTFGHDSGDTYIINCCKTICDILTDEYGLNGSNIYITFHPVDLWGWNGSMF